VEIQPEDAVAGREGSHRGASAVDGARIIVAEDKGESWGVIIRI